MFIKLSFVVLLLVFYTVAEEEKGIKCYVCSSDVEKECIGTKAGSEKCSGLETFVGPNDKPDEKKFCSFRQENGVIKRDYAVKKEEGVTCEEDLCNNDCFAPRKCMDCTGSEESCLNGQSNATCDSDIICSQCYDSETNSITRTCGRDTGSTCYNCWDKDSCNKNLMCYNCKEGKNCADDKDLSITSCETECQVKINKDSSKTERGCKMHDQLCDDSFKCRKCDTHLCNTGTYDDNQLKCYKCSDEKDCNNPQIEGSNSEVCEYYAENYQCYMKLDGAVMERGCWSDIPEPECNEKCKMCNTNICNSMGKTVQSTLKCIQCPKPSASKDGESSDCLFGVSSTEAVACETSMEFFEDESCYTKLLKGNTVERGCRRKNKACTTLDETCTICINDGCNNANLFTQKCSRCNSFVDGVSCAKTGENFKGQECTNKDMITKDTKGCYTMLSTRDYILRGCLVDLSYTDQLQCLDKDNKFCTTCTDSDCNVGAPPNGGSIVTRWRLGVFISTLLALCMRM